MSKPNHRVVAGTQRARQLAAQNAVPLARTLPATDEQQAWNDRVDAEREAKKLAKLANKTGD